MAPPRPKRHMKEAIALYNKGVFNSAEFCALVFKLASGDELLDFVNECPIELLSEIKTCLESYGADESEWPDFGHSVCYAPWVSQEEIAESIRSEQQQIRDGVRLLKTFGPPLSDL